MTQYATCELPASENRPYNIGNKAPPAIPMIRSAEPLAVYLPKPCKASGQIDGQTRALASPSIARNITVLGTRGTPAQPNKVCEMPVSVAEPKATPAVNKMPLTADRSKAFFCERYLGKLPGPSLILHRYYYRSLRDPSLHYL